MDTTTLVAAATEKLNHHYGEFVYVKRDATKLASWLGIPEDHLTTVIVRLSLNGVLEYVGQSRTDSKKYRVHKNLPSPAPVVFDDEPPW